MVSWMGSATLLFIALEEMRDFKRYQMLLRHGSSEGRTG